MGFWTFILISILLASIVNDLLGRRETGVEKHSAETAKAPVTMSEAQQSTSTNVGGAEPAPSITFTGVCREISRVTTWAQESMDRHLLVIEATKQLQQEIMTENILVESTMELAELRLREANCRVPDDCSAF